MFEKRRDNLKKEMLERKLDGLLLTNPSNLYYYTGFTGGDGMLVLAVETAGVLKKDGRKISRSECYLITDSRYYEQVEKECSGISLVRMENRSYSQCVRELLVKDSSIFTENFPVKDKEKNADDSTKISIGLENTMELSQYLKLTSSCEMCKFEPVDEAILKSRMVKDEGEIEKLAKAESIGDVAFTYILEVIKPGVTEREIALELEFFMKRQGAAKLSFDTIVASGPNSSMPHAQVTDRRIAPGDFVTMDFGCVYQGYCSDMTRTIAVGNPTEEMKKVYQIVLDANLRAMEGVREGVACNEVDSLARAYIKEQGYGAYFGHGLGHGVGLDIHEEPRFSPKCEVIALENMVITDEPGIYLPGQFGVRIEDLLVVKKDGYQTLSHAEKNLIIL